MDGFRFSLHQPVVLRDLDGFGHVNNAVYLTYVENGRVAYLKEVVGASQIDDLRNIMASVAIDYRSPANYPEIIEIGVRIPRMGTKSFVMEYKLHADDGRLVVEARSVQVMYDYRRNASIALPDDWRRQINAYDHPGGQ